MLRVDLDPGLPGGRHACLRGLTGRDEQALAGSGVGSHAAIELLDRLLVAVPGTTIGPGDAARLAIGDRDRLLAALHAQLFGDRIESRVRCSACGEGIELGFSLAALLANLGRDTTPLQGPDPAGYFALPEGPRFRLPTGADQAALLECAPERARVELLLRCLAPDEAQHRTLGDLDPTLLARIEAAMAERCPILDLALDITCHVCAAAQQVRFDIQTYLLRALEHEQRYLVREIHYLARAYGWSLAEILELRREDRRRFVELIVAERSAATSRSLP